MRLKQEEETMYARETTAQGKYDRPLLIDLINRTILPGVSGMTGFRSLSASGDPDSGTVWVVSHWATVDDLISSRSGGAQIRKEATESSGGTIVDVREWTTPVMTVSDTFPSEGMPVNVNHHRYDPNLIEEVVGFFSWVAEPVYRSSPGFRSVQMLVDRTTGEVQVESSWDGTETLESGFERLRATRDRAVEKGMTFVERSRRELLHFSAPV